MELFRISWKTSNFHNCYHREFWLKGTENFSVTFFTFAKILHQLSSKNSEPTTFMMSQFHGVLVFFVDSPQEVQGQIDAPSRNESFISTTSTPFPVAQKFRQTTLGTRLNHIVGGTPLQLSSSSGPSARTILCLSEPGGGATDRKDDRVVTSSSKDCSSWQLTPQPVRKINRGMRRVATDSKQLILVRLIKFMINIFWVPFSFPSMCENVEISC